MFPPLSGVQCQPSTHQEFSTFAFWREPIIDLRLGKAVEAVEVTEASSTTASDAAPEPKSEPAILSVVDAAVKDKDEKPAAAAVVAGPAQDKIL